MALRPTAKWPLFSDIQTLLKNLTTYIFVEVLFTPGGGIPLALSSAKIVSELVE